MIVQLITVLVFVSSCYGRSDSEIKGWFLGFAMDCNNKYPIEAQELEMVHQQKLPSSDNVKCLMACIYRSAKLLDEKGSYDLAKTNEWIASEFAEDATRLDNAKTLFNMCKSVNDEKVSDGEKGCERAYLLSKCLTENVSKVGIELTGK